MSEKRLCILLFVLWMLIGLIIPMCVGFYFNINDWKFILLILGGGILSVIIVKLIGQKWEEDKLSKMSLPKREESPEYVKNDVSKTNRKSNEFSSQKYKQAVHKQSLRTTTTNSTKTKKNHTIYLLDGSNIIHWEKETHGVSLDALCSITGYLKSKREDYYVLFDASAPHVLREKNGAELERFNSLLRNDPSHFKMIPAGTRADEYLLEEARRDPKAVILTNDQYRDHVKLYPDVLNDRERRIQHGMIMKGDKDILFRGINLSIPIKRG